MKIQLKDSPSIKLSSVSVLGDKLNDVVDIPMNKKNNYDQTYQDISYVRDGDIGRIKFDFYNGAMSTLQCDRLLKVYNNAKGEDTKALILEGNDNAFSNGIHLNVIEANSDPENES